MILVALHVATILAAKPRPSEAITFKLSNGYYDVGSIERSTSIPPDSKTFEAEEDVLSSISSINRSFIFCAISMTSTTPLSKERLYDTGYLCKHPKSQENSYGNFDSNPPLEIRASIGLIIRGFSAKFDQGDVGVWGHDDPYYYTGWTELGGPVIGFHF